MECDILDCIAHIYHKIRYFTRYRGTKTKQGNHSQIALYVFKMVLYLISIV
jgi:hypothetical protein